MEAHNINTAPTIRATAPNLRRRLIAVEVDVFCTFPKFRRSKVRNGTH